MAKNIALVSENRQTVREERRVVPRFPFSYLTFREDGSSQTFEVRDISLKGMQLVLHHGEHTHLVGSDIVGKIHRKGKEVAVKGKVVWSKGLCMGIEFATSKKTSAALADFISARNLVKGMRPLHGGDLPVELPSNLKYWLQADGSVEIFIWHHLEGGISRFQIILMDKFLEWEDGIGLKVGRILRHQEIERPLAQEEEFTLQMEPAGAEKDCIQAAVELVRSLPQGYIPSEVEEFLITKMGMAPLKKSA